MCENPKFYSDPSIVDGITVKKQLIFQGFELNDDPQLPWVANIRCGSDYLARGLTKEEAVEKVKQRMRDAITEIRGRIKSLSECAISLEAYFHDSYRL